MSPYGIQPQLSDTFFYAPPWAVGFALTSWLPVWLQALLLVVAKILSLRIIGRSWIGAGLACWFPLVAFDLVGGNFNLLVAAAIVAAIRGRPELAVVTALAKLSPILAIRPRDWKRASFAATALVLVTAPVLTLWPDWISHLIEATGLSFGASLPVPLWARAIVGGGLLLLRRPTTTALAAVLMIPAFYWGSLVVLIAPTAVLIEELRRVSLALVASGSPQRDRRDAPPPTQRSNDLPAQPESS
jgi:hypothetical protein